MRRKRNGKKIAAVIVLALLIAAFLLLRFLFVIRNTQVAGIDASSAEALVRSAGIDFGGSIFRVDEDRIARAVNGTGFYAFDAVEAHYPDTLILHVHARRPAAMVSHAGHILILDENGAVIECTDQVPNSDIMYIGRFTISNYDIGQVIAADPKMLNSYCAVARAVLANNAQAYVSELDLSNAEALTIITRRGLKVQLGDAANMMNKIAWMKSAAADLEARGTVSGTLDVASGTKADYMPPSVGTEN